MVGMYDMTPGNYWFGHKWYYVKKAPGVVPPICPQKLSENDKFTNEDQIIDKGLTLKCLDWNVFQYKYGHTKNHQTITLKSISYNFFPDTQLDLFYYLIAAGQFRKENCCVKFWYSEFFFASLYASCLECNFLQNITIHHSISPKLS